VLHADRDAVDVSGRLSVVRLKGPRLSRRAWLGGLGAATLSACERPRPRAASAPASAVSVAPTPHVDPPPFEEIEHSLGGRVGVFALDTGSGRDLAHRADERFAMCSTFKWALVAAVLVRVDRGELRLEDDVPYGSADLLEYAPITRQNVARGAMTLEALAEAAVTVSDNTAANLLLARVDGPAGLTRFFRELGDSVTHLDRTEPTLNTNLPGDERDTTSPRAMVQSMQRVLCGDVLSAGSRESLLGWMKACKTGADRLRAGLPPGFGAGDKTGTGNHGAANDVAIIWPPGKKPLLVASYLSESERSLPALNAAHARIGQFVAGALGA
jgi:beta-lactamase class A